MPVESICSYSAALSLIRSTAGVKGGKNGMVYRGEVDLIKKVRRTLTADEVRAFGIDPDNVKVDARGAYFEEFFQKGAVSAEQQSLWDMCTMKEDVARGHYMAIQNGCKKDRNGLFRKEVRKKEGITRYVMEAPHPVHSDPQRKYLSHRTIILEATPNYLMSAKAAQLTYETALLPHTLRFFVLLREPVSRAYSEFSMFVNWGWHPKGSTFDGLASVEVEKLESCRDSVLQSHHVDLSTPLSQYDDKLIGDYLSHCFPSRWPDHIKNSLYVLGIMNWLRFFDISQFHIITSEDLHASSDMDIIDRVSKHLQLNATSGGELLPHVAEYCTQPKRKQYCKPRKKPLNSQTHTSEESRTADGFSLDVIKHYGQFFEPFNAELERLFPGVTKKWDVVKDNSPECAHNACQK